MVCSFDVAIAMVNTDDDLVVQSFHFRSSLVVLHNGLIEPLVGREYRFPEIPAVDPGYGQLLRARHFQQQADTFIPVAAVGYHFLYPLVLGWREN